MGSNRVPELISKYKLKNLPIDQRDKKLFISFPGTLLRKKGVING